MKAVCKNRLVLNVIAYHVIRCSAFDIRVLTMRFSTYSSSRAPEDCALPVKVNSIQGNKVNNIDVVYTPW
ncbi:hypothetical protein L1887_39387 [Cichorium endivia]|nr:hypothetical protein L1887_39387 [Cichorium endivia]